MQGKEKLFFDVLESIDAFKGKIRLWIHRMKSGKLAAFPGLNLFVEEKDLNLGIILPIFLEHLNTFLSELDRYIPSNDYCRIFNWVRNPFQVSALEVHSDMDCIAEQLLELQSRQMWKDKFKKACLTQFGQMCSQWSLVFQIFASKLQRLFCHFQPHTHVNLAFQL